MSELRIHKGGVGHNEVVAAYVRQDAGGDLELQAGPVDILPNRMGAPTATTLRQRAAWVRQGWGLRGDDGVGHGLAWLTPIEADALADALDERDRLPLKRSPGTPLTVYVSIGNSDDKLTQLEWHLLVDAVDRVISTAGVRVVRVHGRWFSAPDAPWQNACWCLEMFLHVTDWLRGHLCEVAGRYRQDSIAWAEVTTTEFLGFLSEPDEEGTSDERG